MQTLIELLDYNAAQFADQPFYFFSFDATGLSQPTCITQSDFSTATHRLAHLLAPKVDRAHSKVAAIIANIDTLLYHTVFIALMRVGYVPFPISPRNSITAILELMRVTSCAVILGGGVGIYPLLQTIQLHMKTASNLDIPIVDVPSVTVAYPELLDGAMNSETSQQVPLYQPESITAKPSDLAFYVHSSGSTGYPKPIPMTCAVVSSWMKYPCFTDEDGSAKDVRMGAMSAPPFHMIGLNGQLLRLIFHRKPACIFPPTSIGGDNNAPLIPTTDNVLLHCKMSHANALASVPSFLERWAQDDAAIEYLKTLHFISFGGGPLALEIGQLLSDRGVRLQSGYGGTEFGTVTHTAPLDGCNGGDDWSWNRLHSFIRPRFVDQNDGTYELQFLTCKTHLPSVENLPDVHGYATSDIVKRHPSKPDLIRIVGRLDDVIVLSIGEKVVPGPMEKIVASHPRINWALMFGRERNQVGVLVEPVELIDGENEDWLAQFRNDIWPTIEEANRNAPAFGRIFKEMILVTQPGRAMARSPLKGTVVRKLTLSEYEKEIDASYAAVDASSRAVGGLPDQWTSEQLQEWLLQQCEEIAGGKRIDTSVDLFQQGFDSLSATFLRNKIVGALRTQHGSPVLTHLTQNFVFEHPSIQQMSEALSSLVDARPTSGKMSVKSDLVVIQEMLDKYAAGPGMTEALAASKPSASEKWGVLLTGSTGGLGSHLLEELIRRDSVNIVYAFNRSSTHSIGDRQRAAFKARGLNMALLDSLKLVYLEGDLAAADFQLDAVQLRKVREDVNVIIHNAWRLDFNLSLTSFEPLLQGTRNLVDFARSSANSSPCRVIFTSSVASVQAWNSRQGKVPESIINDTHVALGSGYGEAKFVCEQTLAASGLDTCSIRIGQISGSPKSGAWALTDWVPILVKSSVEMGMLPIVLGNAHSVFWIDPNTVAGSVADVALYRGKHVFEMLNLVHHQPMSWNALIEALSNALVSEQICAMDNLKSVPLKEWYTTLVHYAKDATAEVLLKIPAIKLLNFFGRLSLASEAPAGTADSLPDFDTSRMQTISTTFREAKAVGADQAHFWVKYWKDEGLFDV